MRPCISLVTMLSTRPLDALEAVARAGWRDVELWLTPLEEALAEHGPDVLRSRLAELDLRAVAAAGQGGLGARVPVARQAQLDLFRRRLDLLAALGVEMFVVAPQATERPDESDLAVLLDVLATHAEEAATRNLRLALEFQRGTACASLDTAAAVVAQVGSAHLGVCLDLFHFYTGPSKFEDLELLAPGMLAWIQLSDVAGTPRELVRDADRILPGDGDFRIDAILDAVTTLGYDGGVSLEAPNPSLWEIPADRVAGVAKQSLDRVLDRLRRGPGVELESRRSPGGS